MDVYETEKLNIRPPASIYSIFERLQYKPTYAIAEFVDNSTASFFQHENLMKFCGIKKVNVWIIYDKDNKTLTIEDDAFGMDINDFKRAILLNAKPEDTSGRNEFGMGLKTAASWFGRIRSVESTRLNDNRKYFAEVNIPELTQTGNDEIEIKKFECDPAEHGTKIVIKNLSKDLTYNSLKSIKDLLSSMYRKDFLTGKVNIVVDGDKLSFNPYQIMVIDGKEERKELNFDFTFNDKTYNVNGFVGILAKEDRGYKKAGFALLRRNRVVIGFEGNYYKPRKIFRQSQSQISLKLFGELNLDCFEINQSKDDFMRSEDEEMAFIMALKDQIQDYIEFAKKPAFELDAIINAEKEEIDQITPLGINESEIKIDSGSKDTVPVKGQKSTVVTESIPHDQSYLIENQVKWTCFWENLGDQVLEIDYENNFIKLNKNHEVFKKTAFLVEGRKSLEKIIISVFNAIKTLGKQDQDDRYYKKFKNFITHYIKEFLKEIREND